MLRSLLPVSRALVGRHLIVRPLSISSRALADPFPLPFSDPSLASASSSSSASRSDSESSEEWPLPQPLDRTGEDESRIRARLVYQTRKRGTLETDLLLSTFARDELPKMGLEEMREFDKLLDEPDWDIFYWSVFKREPPARWKDTPLLKKLQQHAKNEGKVVRMMPELMQREPEK
ncbi:succinate dehydrogenase assembly factor 2 [Saitozyma podzolica]|uniref:Succinate dehydrogenase assembly factor 2, mitochondrial n=1 Tax=Saitozyma podzolica TaxID=1890683 RepID=A0A427XYM4_9TREE|nr:succinate dehydrogenase assembly factor 2 [Saitozyma podzolica]